MPIAIREATADDLEDLARLRWQMHTERHPADERDFDHYGLGFARWWSAQDGRCRAVVATDEDQVLGMGSSPWSAGSFYERSGFEHLARLMTLDLSEQQSETAGVTIMLPPAT